MSLLFKSLQVVRFYDANASARLSGLLRQSREGSPKNAIIAVPVTPWRQNRGD
ncbi:CreA family protein [Escherichia coli]